MENRLAYGLIADVFGLAALYAVAIATVRCFANGNKRTTHRTMDTCLDIDGVEVAWNLAEVGPLIVGMAQGRVDVAGSAEWLRVRARV